EGSITVGGSDITKASAERRARLGIRRSFQHPLLVEDATAIENVLLGDSDAMKSLDKVRLALGRRHSERFDRAMAVLTLVGLADRAIVPARDLSYGERKLLDIGR